MTKISIKDLTKKKKLQLRAWAVMDTQKDKQRWCYVWVPDFERNQKSLAIYEEKPFIPDRWKDVKEVVPVLITWLT